MTISEARKLFPKETEILADEVLQTYCNASEVLSQIFLNTFTQNLKQTIDNTEDHEQ